jgi:hypothetical protein
VKKIQQILLFACLLLHLNMGPLFSTSVSLYPEQTVLADYEGVTWRCKKCGYYNYSESPDWKGDYFCLRCKTRKGDE